MNSSSPPITDAPDTRFTRARRQRDVLQMCSAILSDLGVVSEEPGGTATTQPMGRVLAPAENQRTRVQSVA